VVNYLIDQVWRLRYNGGVSTRQQTQQRLQHLQDHTAASSGAGANCAAVGGAGGLVVTSRTMHLPVTLSGAQIASLPPCIVFDKPLPLPHPGPWENSAPSVDVAPTCWLALGDRYAFHLGTSRVWDTWSGGWCPAAWRTRWNVPRVSVVQPPSLGRAQQNPKKEWVSLSSLLARWVPRPALRPDGWVLAFHTDAAREALNHERVYGRGSAPLNALSLLWVLRGRPSYLDCSPFTAGWNQGA
jgi:hypothetical protein